MKYVMSGLRVALFIFKLALAVLVAGAALSVGGYARGHFPQHHVIIDSPGGRIDQFYINYSLERRRGDTFEIDGECDSACTLITALVPNDRVCVTPHAMLGFHSAWQFSEDDTRVFAADATEWLWRLYPPKVRKLLRAHGWRGPTEHPDLIRIDGDELLSIYKPCK